MTEISPLLIALFEPQIPPNTGNIARTSAAFRVPLTLIEPLGFQVDDRSVRRAGLDYWPHVQLSIAPNFSAFKAELLPDQRLIGCSRRGGASLSSFEFRRGDVLLFGREDTGLPDPIREACDTILTIPMPGAADDAGKGGVRSLNLSVACALVTYVAGEQLRLW
jgi:tRNA (cytidine/uridine-2'-O-)-methyltransferase